MKNQNIIEDISGLTIPEIIEAARNLSNGCGAVGSPFTFTGTTFTYFQGKATDYPGLYSDGQISGDHVKIQLAEDCRLLLIIAYGVVAAQVNIQAAHDLVKLKGSGGILTELGGPLGILKQAVILGTTSTVPDEIIIELDTLEKSVGTMVYWTDLTAGTPQQSEFFAQKHFIHLDGLIIDHQYELQVAHKGTVRKVILSAPQKCWCR